MMNKKEAIELIKNATHAVELLFTGNKEADKVEETFDAVKETEGNVLVQVDGELAVGTPVSTSSSQGSEPAADGDYKLANGVEIKVKDGLVSEVVSEGDAPAEELAVEGTPEEEATETPEEEVKEDADSANTIKTLEAKVAELEAELAKLKEGFSTIPTNETLENFTTQLIAFQSAIEVLATTPAEFTKVDRSIEAKDDKANKLNALAGLMNNK